MLALDGDNLSPYHFGMGILTKYRDRAGLSQQGLADLVGTSQPQIQRLEKGKRGLSKKWAIRIAPHVQTIPETLVFGDRTVPIVGHVGAGSEAHFYGDAVDNFGRARMPLGGSEETVAVEVRGDSLGVAFDGWLVYYDERRNPPTPDLLGTLCVVGLISGQVLVKLLMRGRAEGRFDLFPGASGLPLLDQSVEWAARVIAVMSPQMARIDIPDDNDFPTPARPKKKAVRAEKKKVQTKKSLARRH